MKWCVFFTQWRRIGRAHRQGECNQKSALRELRRFFSRPKLNQLEPLLMAV